MSVTHGPIEAVRFKALPRPAILAVLAPFGLGPQASPDRYRAGRRLVAVMALMALIGFSPSQVSATSSRLDAAPAGAISASAESTSRAARHSDLNGKVVPIPAAIGWQVVNAAPSARRSAPLTGPMADRVIDVLANRLDASDAGNLSDGPYVAPAQQALARHISRGWRVDAKQTQRYIAKVWRATDQLQLDPFLVLGIIATESSFNPKARSGRGAQGLMQVHTRVHREKFKAHGGPARAFDPEASIRVGTQILRQYLDRYGSERNALKAYVGAARLRSDGGYANRVFKRQAEFERAVHSELTQVPTQRFEAMSVATSAPDRQQRSGAAAPPKASAAIGGSDKARRARGNGAAATARAKKTAKEMTRTAKSAGTKSASTKAAAAKSAAGAG